MNLTKHAKLRWEERFASTLNLHQEWSTAQIPGKKTRRKLKAQMMNYYERTKQVGRYFLVSRNNVVFVCAPPGENVVSVFPLTGNTDWKRYQPTKEIL